MEIWKNLFQAPSYCLEHLWLPSPLLPALLLGVSSLVWENSTLALPCPVHSRLSCAHVGLSLPRPPPHSKAGQERIEEASVHRWMKLQGVSLQLEGPYKHDDGGTANIASVGHLFPSQALCQALGTQAESHQVPANLTLTPEWGHPVGEGWVSPSS